MKVFPFLFLLFVEKTKYFYENIARIVAAINVIKLTFSDTHVFKRKMFLYSKKIRFYYSRILVYFKLN